MGLWQCPQASRRTVEPGTCSGLVLLQPLPLATNSLSKQRVTPTLSNSTMIDMEQWRMVYFLDFASSKDLRGLCCSWMPCWLPRSMQLPGDGVGGDVDICERAAARGHFDVCGSCCLPNGGHVDVCGLCCHMKPYWCSWSLLPPEDMRMSVA